MAWPGTPLWLAMAAVLLCSASAGTVWLPEAENSSVLTPIELTGPVDVLAARYVTALKASLTMHEASRVESGNYLTGACIDLYEVLEARGEEGRQAFEHLLEHADPDVRYHAAIMLHDRLPGRCELVMTALQPLQHKWRGFNTNPAAMLKLWKDGPAIVIPRSTNAAASVPPSASPLPEATPLRAPVDRPELERLIAASGLAASGQAIQAALRPEVSISQTMMPDERIPLGVSKEGGLPDLPAGMPWPVRRGRSLPFIAQFNMPDVANADLGHQLPTSGHLYLFWDADSQPGICSADADADNGAALYVDGEPVLARAARPRDMVPTLVFKSARLSMAGNWSLPRDAVLADLPEEQEPAYEKLEAEVMERHVFAPGVPAPFQLLGYDAPEQDRMDNGFPGGPQAWCLLAQVGSDEQVFGGSWGDGGKIYAWIRRADLAARRFDQVIFLAQCG